MKTSIVAPDLASHAQIDLILMAQCHIINI